MPSGKSGEPGALETQKRKVRKKQIGAIDSTAVVALFPQLAMVVSIH